MARRSSIDPRAMFTFNACMIHRRIPLLAAMLWCAAAPIASAQDWKPQKIWVSGSDKSVWVAASGPASDASMPVIEMWYAGARQSEAGFEKPSQSSSLAAMLGEVEQLGADALVLRVLFSNLDSSNYAVGSSSLGGVLWRQQSDTPPLAWGGDASLGVFYAVSLTSELKAQSRQLIEPAGTQPAEDEDEDEEEAEASQAAPVSEVAIESRAACLRLRDNRWERIACPAQSDAADDYWVTGRGGSPCLFWRSSGGDVYFSGYEGGAWSEPETIGAPKEFSFARVGVGENGPVFIAAVPTNDSRVNLHIFQRTQQGWQDMSAAREGSELFVGDPAKLDVAIARNELAVARLTQEGKIEFGSGALGVSPPLTFDELNVKTPPQTGPDWKSIVFMVVVLSLVTLLFWARRDIAVHPLALPPGWMLAATWKRALAAMIDAIPAMVLGAMLVMSLHPDTLPGSMSAMFDQMNDPEFIRRALPISIAMWTFYGLWCFAWEVFIATTPGKRLFNCRVFSIDGSRPGVPAVALRNLTRAILLPLGGESGALVMLMTMVFLTRNRQRPGDLLAKTLVLEPRREGYGLFGQDGNNNRQDPPGQ